MKKRLLAMILASAMLMSLYACTKSKDNKGGSKTTDSLSSDVGNTDKGGTDDSSWNPELSQRDVIRSNDSMCGVLYLGYAESDMFDMKNNRRYYDEFFRTSGGIEKFGFLKEIPDDRFVCTPMGHDLYIIVPADPKAHVEVNLLKMDEENDFALKVEDTLYTSNVGAPIVLQCNYSDLFSDAEIIITDSEGQTLKWSPFISLRNGKVYNKTEDGKIIYDFTEYQFTDDDEEDND